MPKKPDRKGQQKGQKLKALNKSVLNEDLLLKITDFA